MRIFILIYMIYFMVPYPCLGKETGQKVQVKGGTGVELAIPYGYVNFLPGIRVKTVLPLDLHPWEKPWEKKVATALSFHWGNRFIMYGGNISFGGPTSLFTRAAPSLTANPLGNFSFPATTITVGMPSYSESAADYGVAMVASFGKGFAKDRINIWVSGSENKRFFSGFNIPLRVKAVNLGISSAVGLWLLEENLPNEEDSWYSKKTIYDEVWLKGMILEGQLTWNLLRLYGGGAVVEQPQGGFGYWGRVRGAVNIEVKSADLQFLTGVYGGRPNSITATGSIVRESFQSYINPQVQLDLEDFISFFKGAYLDLGLAFGASVKNTNELQSQLFVDGKLRGGMALSLPRFTLKFTGDWLGIPISNKKLKTSLRSQEKYGGKINLTLTSLIPKTNLGFWASSYFEKGSNSTRDTILVGGGLNLYHQKDGKKPLVHQLIFSAVPKLSATTEVAFIKQGKFQSATTEAKATWNFQFPLVKVGGWVAVELKHTTK